MTEAPITAIDRSEHGGSVFLVMILAFCFLGAIGAFFFLPPELGARVIGGLLAVLAMIGVFALFALAVGFMQFSGQAGKNDITKILSDTSSDGLLVTEGDGRIIYANETYLTLSEAQTPGDVRSVERLFSGSAEIAEAVYRLAKAAREGECAAEEIRLSPPLVGEAPVGWYRIRVRPERLGEKKATLWVISDVTRERERHETVFQELQHAIDFLDHAPAGFFSANQEGRITYMNATLASWLDYDLAQVGLGGMTLQQLVAGAGSALLMAVSGKAHEQRVERIDIDLKRRNGQSLPVRLLHSVLFSAEGTLCESRTLVLNRAAGEEPAEDLRASEVRFARFFNTTPMAIAILDREGCVRRSNAAFAKLLPAVLKEPEDQRLISNRLADRDKAAYAETLAVALSGRSDAQPVDIALEGDGAKSVRIFLTPAEDSDNGSALMLYALDMTEQRTLQENFAQSQKMQAIGQLAGGVAHDFNNVLTAIIGYSDLLLANHRPTDPSFQDIMQIKQNANRAAGLVRQLLAFSRRQTLRPQVLQIADLLSDLQMLAKRLLGEKIALEMKHGRDLWLVKADLNQLEQVVVNLVVNARDAMPEGGRIILRTKNIMRADCVAYREPLLTAGEYLLLEVEDTGTGIPPEILEKIFEPFFTTKEVGKGTGLGLSMVYGIVKQTGGFVFVESHVGRGTVFRIFLPRYIPTEAEIAPKQEVTKSVADLTGHGTVLLVEDEEAVRAFGARALSSRGYTVLEAGSGIEALQVVEENNGKIDLVVSDVVMPEMDGPTMLGELRKRGVKAKVIFVSGYAEEAFSRNLPEGEDFGFLPKPFTLKQLVETVKNNIGGKSEGGA